MICGEVAAGWALRKIQEWTLNSGGSNQTVCRIFKRATGKGAKRATTEKRL